MITREQVSTTFTVAKTAVAVLVAVVQGVELVAAAAGRAQHLRNRNAQLHQPRSSERGWRVGPEDWEYEPDLEDIL